MTDLDLLYSADETELRTTVAAVLDDHCAPDLVASLYDGDRSRLADLWRRLAGDVGVAGLLVPEDRGGVGAGLREAAVVLEEEGRHVAPTQFLTSGVVATSLLLGAGATGPTATLVEGLATGRHSAALAEPLALGPDAAPYALELDDRGRVHGTARGVAGALQADTLLVPARTGPTTVLLAVPATAATIEPVVSLDMSRQLADVRLDAAEGEVVLDDAEAAVRRALLVGAGLLASEQLGVARWCLSATVGYLKERRQFGRVVGGFQALKHRLADLYVTVESAAAAARYAAAALDADDDVEVAVRVAAAFCGDAAVLAAEEAVQLHGGIGMTWEHPTHLYLKRAKADQVAFGVPGAHRAALAALVDLPAPV